jgi:hypothetical protein
MDIELAYLVQHALGEVCSWSGLVDYLGWQGMAGLLSLIFWTSALVNIGLCIKGLLRGRVEEIEKDEHQDFFIVMRLAGIPMNETVYCWKKGDGDGFGLEQGSWDSFFAIDVPFGYLENGFAVALPHIMIT